MKRITVYLTNGESVTIDNVSNVNFIDDRLEIIADEGKTNAVFLESHVIYYLESDMHSLEITGMKDNDEIGSEATEGK